MQAGLRVQYIVIRRFAELAVLILSDQQWKCHLEVRPTFRLSIPKFRRWKSFVVS